MSKPLILLVGHCGPDSYALRSAAGRAAPEAEVMFIHDDEALKQHLARAELLLVNRVLEAGFENSSGIKLITDLAQTKDGPWCMLISNFADAQAEAEAAGALPGFGKSAMNSEEAGQRIRSALGQSAQN